MILFSNMRFIVMFVTAVCVLFLIRHKNLEYLNLVHAHKPKFGLVFLRLPVPNFFLVPLLSFFSVLLLLLPFAFHILSGCPKKLGVN